MFHFTSEKTKIGKQIYFPQFTEWVGWPETELRFLSLSPVHDFYLTTETEPMYSVQNNLWPFIKLTNMVSLLSDKLVKVNCFSDNISCWPGCNLITRMWLNLVIFAIYGVKNFTVVLFWKVKWQYLPRITIKYVPLT